MNTIKNKLRSQSGASLMLALLFLLFCVLIGGTILAAASANGFRVTRVTSKQQELKDNSAAMLIADQLGDISLTIDTAESPVKATLTGTYTPMGRLVAEMAVCKYLKDTGKTEANLVCNGTTIPKGSFWYKQGSSDDFVCTVKLSGTGLDNQEVEVSMSGYNITVSMGEDSHVIVQVKGNKTGAEGEIQSISWKELQIKKEG